MDSNEIKKRQNNKKNLKIQYAARRYFNAAEWLNRITWTLFFILACSIFFNFEKEGYFSIIINFSVSLFVFILPFIVKRKTETAAKLRNYFDTIVLGFDDDKVQESIIHDLNEIACATYKKNIKKSEIQIQNNGESTPPGVYDWYAFNKNYKGLSAQLECQRQNSWWTKKMLYRRFVLLAVITLLSISIIFYLFINFNPLFVLTSFFGILFRTIERIIENFKYLKISAKIEGSLQTVEAQPTKEGVLVLQSFINKRRTIAVFENSILHRLSAKALSRLYNDRTA